MRATHKNTAWEQSWRSWVSCVLEHITVENKRTNSFLIPRPELKTNTTVVVECITMKTEDLIIHLVKWAV